MSVTSKALWYIESHLSGDVTLDAIADVAEVSRFHLSRAFGLNVGCALASYVRARRLSEAARSLVNGAPDILTLALDTGYSSHEAFTRAFRQHFGLSPEQLRERASIGGLDLQEPIRMSDNTATTVAPPRIVRQGALLIFGLGQRMRSNAGIPQQWDRFIPHLGHIQHQVGKVTYGVICNTDDTEVWEYVCGVEVSEFPDHPAEFTRLRIPPQTYAVFEHNDHVSEVSKTWKAIWDHELTAAGQQAADGPAFERYDERFDSRTGRGGFELWVPVRS